MEISLENPVNGLLDASKSKEKPKEPISPIQIKKKLDEKKFICKSDEQLRINNDDKPGSFEQPMKLKVAN